MKNWQFFTANELQPQGWLRTQLEIQAAGLCGNLDKMWPDVRDSAWIGGEREGWERVPYWLDGFIPLAYLLQDDEMIARAKTYIEAILSQQDKDGWICPCPPSERSTYDTWAIQLISKILVVYYECSKDERIPTVVYRVLKNYYKLLSSGEITLFDWAKARWFETFIAINFTYRYFPENWLRELAKILHKQGTDYSTCLPLWRRPLNKWTYETHIVNLAMMLKQEAICCDLLGKDYQDLAEKLYRTLKKYNGTPVELFTGDECLSGNSPIQGSELCSVVELMYSYELLYAYTGDNKWAERLETIAFNALPATISEDMWTHQYVQMSNQIACQAFPGKSLFRTNGSEAHLFGLEPHFGCCTANFGQGWPKLALSTFLHCDDTVISAIPLPGRLHTQDLTITLDTNYPFENRLTYTITSQRNGTFCVRIPSFAHHLTVNGEPVSTGDLSFKFQSNSTQKLIIEFQTSPYFESRPHGLNTVKCGSLVFALPISHTKLPHEYEKNGVERKFPYCDYELIPTANWNYAFSSSALECIPQPFTGTPFSEEHPPIKIKTTLQPIEWGYEDGYETVCAKVPFSTKPTAAAQEMEFIPYGCAKLRLTELPFTE